MRGSGSFVGGEGIGRHVSAVDTMVAIVPMMEAVRPIVGGRDLFCGGSISSVSTVGSGLLDSGVEEGGKC